MFVNNPEIKEAIHELTVAENNFNWCEPEYIDVATYRVSAARAKINALIKSKKKEAAMA